MPVLVEKLQQNSNLQIEPYENSCRFKQSRFEAKEWQLTRIVVSESQESQGKGVADSWNKINDDQNRESSIPPIPTADVKDTRYNRIWEK